LYSLFLCVLCFTLFVKRCVCECLMKNYIWFWLIDVARPGDHVQANMALRSQIDPIFRSFSESWLETLTRPTMQQLAQSSPTGDVLFDVTMELEWSSGPRQLCDYDNGDNCHMIREYIRNIPCDRWRFKKC